MILKLSELKNALSVLNSNPRPRTKYHILSALLEVFNVLTLNLFQIIVQEYLLFLRSDLRLNKKIKVWSHLATDVLTLKDKTR